MKNRIKVAVGQIEIVPLDSKRNASTMKECVEKIFDENKVDLVLFPELANTGYIKPVNRDFGREFRKCAEPIPGYTTNMLGKLGEKYHVYIVAGLAEVHPQIPGTLYNSSVLIDPTGQIVGVYHKVHIPVEEKHYFYPGNTLEVYRVDIGNIGMMICYDNLFSELSRILALKGMEILCSNYQWSKPTEENIPHIPDRLRCISTYEALSNKTHVMACHPVGSYWDYVFDGHSTIVDSSGETLAYATEEGKDEILFAELSNDRLLEARSNPTVFRDRRPELYDMLSQPY